MNNDNAAMNYKDLLEYSFEETKRVLECPPQSRLAYLSEYVFDFTTYDDDISELFGGKAVDVCAVITNGETFSYIQCSEENYRWFLIMCNMPFFANRIEWGTSIRGAWWKSEITIDSTGLWNRGEQILLLQCSYDEWIQFMKAVDEFASVEMRQSDQLKRRTLTKNRE